MTHNQSHFGGQRTNIVKIIEKYHAIISVTAIFNQSTGHIAYNTTCASVAFNSIYIHIQATRLAILYRTRSHTPCNTSHIAITVYVIILCRTPINSACVCAYYTTHRCHIPVAVQASLRDNLSARAIIVADYTADVNRFVRMVRTCGNVNSCKFQIFYCAVIFTDKAMIFGNRITLRYVNTQI